MSSPVLAFDTIAAPPRNLASEDRQYPRYPIELAAEFTLPTKGESRATRGWHNLGHQFGRSPLGMQQQLAPWQRD